MTGVTGTLADCCQRAVTINVAAFPLKMPAIPDQIRGLVEYVAGFHEEKYISAVNAAEDTETPAENAQTQTIQIFMTCPRQGWRVDRHPAGQTSDQPSTT